MDRAALSYSHNKKPNPTPRKFQKGSALDMTRRISRFEETERIEALALESRRRMTRQLGARLSRCICDLPKTMRTSFHRPPNGQGGAILAHA